MKGHWKFQGGGSHKSQNFRLAKYEAKLEFPVGMGGAKPPLTKDFLLGIKLPWALILVSRFK